MTPVTNATRRDLAWPDRTNDTTTYPEDELRFYARHRALHEAGDWQGLGDLFTDDASYLDSVYGWSHGLPTIRSFLERSLTGGTGPSRSRRSPTTRMPA